MAVLPDIIGIPTDQLFQGILLPVLIVFAILWALLNSIRVFNRKINLVLSLALTAMIAFTPQFTIFTTYVAQLGAQVAISAFFILFAFGSIMWMFGRGRGIYYEMVSPAKKMEMLNKKYSQYMQKAREAEDRNDGDSYKEWIKRAKDTKDEMDMQAVKR